MARSAPRLVRAAGPPLAIAVALIGGLFVVCAAAWALGRDGHRIVSTIVALSSLSLLPASGRTYECDGEELRVRSFWGRVDRYPLATLRQIETRGPWARARFARRSFDFDVRRHDQRALLERLRERAPA